MHLLLFLAAAQDASALIPVRSIPLPGVEGRIDHLALDADGHRLFVAALGNNTVEAIDLESGRRVHQLEGIGEAQGVLYRPDSRRLFVTSGEAGTTEVFEGDDWEHVASIRTGADSDNIRWDPRTGRIVVGYGGEGDAGLAFVDPADLTVGRRIALAAHPESFQLESDRPRAFVNVPDAGQIAVVDCDAGRVTATWPLNGAAANFPMALDEEAHRLLVACRQPPLLLAFDTTSGREVARLDGVGDADDVFVDRAAAVIYVSGGGGAISVFGMGDGGALERRDDVPTAAGARTCLLVPESRTIYLAVPHRGEQRAEVREFHLP